eukprot:3932477-Rhodomonas_salina.2
MATMPLFMLALLPFMATMPLSMLALLPFMATGFASVYGDYASVYMLGLLHPQSVFGANAHISGGNSDIFGDNALPFLVAAGSSAQEKKKKKKTETAPTLQELRYVLRRLCSDSSTANCGYRYPGTRIRHPVLRRDMPYQDQASRDINTVLPNSRILPVVSPQVFRGEIKPNFPPLQYKLYRSCGRLHLISQRVSRARTPTVFRTVSKGLSVCSFLTFFCQRSLTKQDLAPPDASFTW